MAVFGIDISAHNVGLNLQAAKNEGVRFAILRAGYTGYGWCILVFMRKYLSKRCG